MEANKPSAGSRAESMGSVEESVICGQPIYHAETGLCVP